MARDFKHILRVESPGEPPLELVHSGSISRLRRALRVPVPAGKTKLAIVEPTALSGASEPKFLRLHSTVEGVTAWPIDSADPEIDEDTSEIGWLLNQDWPDYEHDHGTSSNVSIPLDHTANATRPYYSELPSFSSYKLDRQDKADASFYSQSGGAWLVYTDKQAGKLADPEQAYDQTRPATATTTTNAGIVVCALLGKDAPLNLGVAGDGLSFYPAFYVADGANLGDLVSGFCGVHLQLCSYPYSTLYPNPEDIPALTPHGYEPFSVYDTQLDFLAPDGGFNVGWGIDFGGSGITFDVGATTAKSALYQQASWLSGQLAVEIKKSTFLDRYGNGVVSLGGLPVWNRITMIQVALYYIGTGTYPKVGWLGDIWFGPKPGSRRILRPLAYLTSQHWSLGSQVAVALQNKTGADAVVTIDYGGLPV